MSINTHKIQHRPIAVDLFAGAGGMTLGFEQAGFDVLASVEIDPVHCAIHQFNFPFWSILCKSVNNLTGNEIRKLSTISDQEIDVVFGGPPCQGFSMIGKRSLDDERNALVYHYIRLVLELQPKFFVLENVKGMTLGQHQKFITEIIYKFEENGYQVCHEYQVLNAAAYGVPQNRERLFLLGCLYDRKLPNYPEPITKPANLKKTKLEENLPLSPTVWDALQDLPTIENYPELSEKDWIIADFGQPSDYVKKICGFETSYDDFSYDRNYNSSILTSSLRTKHSPESIQRFANTLGGKTEPISRFYKLHPNGICNTLRAGTASNRGAFTSPRPIHPFIPRCITVREAARLHSYPDWFRFHGTKWHGFRQIGNSVPPLLAKAIASEIMKALEIKPYKPKVIQNLGNSKLINFVMTESAKHFGVNRHVIEPRKIKKIINKIKIICILLLLNLEFFSFNNF
ncbi:DNA (cytosine-5-)-methyltransferase [Aphanothece hegewaldii CCALA 016]|uniref:Cytosine-specific methyltransferase n=1 Tax=Aphanothece hegewaldii CCALA 016 TaxID=2107694 RepID=A0A2T1M320_9CHRO|nr:DNA cytosine methyltransferase [Aphanothece hegewaldii]PSF39225.1 DNA (cytosine-5-)-methyltransferase [Aphanothece hegewaldii CCALA 016]